MAAKGRASAGMDLKELKKLISLMNENELVELEISEKGRRFVLKKSPPGFVAHNHVAQSAAESNGTGLLPVAPAAKGGSPRPTMMDGAVTFNSPIVGTFYRSASPGTEPFVKVGDKVTAETVLCLIEAMKVFNEIKAEMSGTIVEVLVENQEAVEFNQPLFLIQP